VDIDGNRKMYMQRNDLNDLQGKDMIKTIQGQQKQLTAPKQVKEEDSSDEIQRKE
jgi:hypothetical protein